VDIRADQAESAVFGSNFLRAVLPLISEKEALLMGEDDEIKNELAEIKKLLEKAQRRAEVEWTYSLGIALMFGSLALLAINAHPWGILLTFFMGLVLMVISPYLGRKS